MVHTTKTLRRRRVSRCSRRRPPSWPTSSVTSRVLWWSTSGLVLPYTTATPRVTESARCPQRYEAPVSALRFASPPVAKSSSYVQMSTGTRARRCAGCSTTFAITSIRVRCYRSTSATTSPTKTRLTPSTTTVSPSWCGTPTTAIAPPPRSTHWTIPNECGTSPSCWRGSSLADHRIPWVCSTLAASLPSSPRTSVSSTMTRFPMCSGRLCALTVPPRVAAKKLVLDSMVAVPPAPSGRFRNAHTPPAESARAMTIPPCSTLLPVQSVGAQSRLSTTSSGRNVSAVMPRVAHSGTCAWINSVAAASVMSSPSNSVQRRSGFRVGRVERLDRNLGDRDVQRRANDGGHAEECQLLIAMKQAQRHRDVGELGALGNAARIRRQLGVQLGQPRVACGVHLPVQAFEDVRAPLCEIGDAWRHAVGVQRHP